MIMKKVDLHIHSMYSDGTYTVKEIIERAKENQVELISICDHNCIKAYDELENKKLDVKILPGVEIFWDIILIFMISNLKSLSKKIILVSN